jgi:hypothetical protein
MIYFRTSNLETNMSPYLSFVFIAKVYPIAIRIMLALVGTYALLETYYGWAERFSTKPGIRAARTWTLALFLPLALAFVLSGLAFWFVPYREQGFVLWFDRSVSIASAITATFIFGRTTLLFANPHLIVRPMARRIRTRSRASLGY